MNFRNFRLSGFLPNFIIAMAYPAVRAFSSETNRLLQLVNAMTIIGLVIFALSRRSGGKKKKGDAAENAA